MATRFVKTSLEEINKLKKKSKNENTKKATMNWMRVFQSWADNSDQEKNIETMEPTKLDEILSLFYAEVRKVNGREYEPQSLAVMQAAIDRYLKEKGYQTSILTSIKFMSSRSILEGKAWILREKGMGKKPNKAVSITEEEEETLWSCGQLCSSSPQPIINTLWWKLTQHFGLRGRQEHHTMKVEDFIPKNANGIEYLTFSEGITKTRQPGLHSKERLQLPKMFATGTNRCPVALFKLYLEKRPVQLQKSGPFYLSTITNPVKNVWYKVTPMGVHKINTLMKTMVENSPLADTSRKLTNHTARKTVVKN